MKKLTEQQKLDILNIKRKVDALYEAVVKETVYNWQLREIRNLKQLTDRRIQSLPILQEIIEPTKEE